MMKPIRVALLFPTLVSLVASAACGSSTPPAEEPGEPVSQAEEPPAAEPEEQRVDPWAAMDTHGLRSYVQARARERIAEVQSDFQFAELDRYRETPDEAPEIAGRTVERLMDVAVVAIASGDLDAAEKTVRLVRARARNRNSAYAGNTLLSEIARRRAGDDPEAQEAAIAEVFRELPSTRFGSSTVVYQIFQTEEQLTARVAQLRSQLLSTDTASSVLFFTEVMPAVVAARERYMNAIATVSSEHASGRAPQDYRFSTVDMTRARRTTPVRMAVWDLGTATDLFEERLFASTEQANGEDDDGNGQVDDIHGLVDVRPHTELLYQPAPEVLERYGPFLQGLMDLRAGIADSDAAQQVLALFRSADSVEALEELESNLDKVGEWAHGTHVAGLMVAGLPQARLAVFRSVWAGEARIYHHRGPTDEELASERANVEAIAEFINRHEIRVVNASLGFSRDYVENQLRHEGERYASDEAVKARADEIMQHRKASWELVFERCPNALFVVAAGNSNRDVAEYGDVPASLSYPNVLVVGAVDRFGNWATFTNSNEAQVRIFDFGVGVESLVPNGERVPLSGTSMASPNVANLAGKMLAYNAELTPTEVIEIIIESGDEIAAPFNGRIANERRAIARAQARR
ncbi:MAG: S8 family serine peptidase [Myxococcota bacterium]